MTSQTVERKFIAYIIVGIVGIFVANYTIWFNRTIYDADTFSEIAVEGLTSESSRNAIAAQLTDRLLQNRPVLQTVLGDRITKVLAGLLDSNTVERIYGSAANRLHNALTSENNQPVTIDLTSFKTIAVNIVNAVARATQDADQTVFNVESLPDSITLFARSSIPNMSRLSAALLWLSPLILIIGLVALAIPIINHRKNTDQLLKILLWEGIGLVSAGVISLFIGQLMKPYVLRKVTDEQVRIVAGNIYEGFLQSFNEQTYFLVGIGLILVIVYGIFRYRERTSKT